MDLNDSDLSDKIQARLMMEGAVNYNRGKSGDTGGVVDMDTLEKEFLALAADAEQVPRVDVDISDTGDDDADLQILDSLVSDGEEEERAASFNIDSDLGNATQTLAEWEKFPRPSQLDNSLLSQENVTLASVNEEEDDENPNNELTIADESLFLPTVTVEEDESSSKELNVVSETLVERMSEGSVELDGTSSLVRREVDISKLFYYEERIETRAPPVVSHAPELEISRAQCRALESKVESLTRQLQHQQAEATGDMVPLVIVTELESLLDEKTNEIGQLKQSLERKNAELTAFEQNASPVDESAPHMDHVEQVTQTDGARQEENEISALRLEIKTLNSDLQELSVVHQETAAHLNRLVDENQSLKLQIEEQTATINNLEPTRYALEQATLKNKRMEAQILQMDWSLKNSGGGGGGGHDSPRSHLRQSMGAFHQPPDDGPSPPLPQPKEQVRHSWDPSSGSRESSEFVLQPIRIPDSGKVIEDQLRLQQQEEAVLKRLEQERTRLKDAQSRIKRANLQSSKSLEMAMNEIRVLEVARQQAEAQATALEKQVQRTQRDMVRLQSIVASPMQSSREVVIPEPYKNPQPYENENEAIPQFAGQPPAPVQLPVQQPIQAPTEAQYYLTEQQEQMGGESRETPGVGPGQDRVSWASSSGGETRETAGVGPGQGRVDWASSRESLAPFATESSTKDLANGFSLLERKLMMINLEREKCEHDFDKLTRRGVKTKKALDEKIYLEKRLEELHQEASNVRIALKRQPK